jgi:hypothetical protein
MASTSVDGILRHLSTIGQSICRSVVSRSSVSATSSTQVKPERNTGAGPVARWHFPLPVELAAGILSLGRSALAACPAIGGQRAVMKERKEREEKR